MTAVYLFALLIGLGAWLPSPTPERRFWYGYLFLQSWLLLIVLLYLGNVVLGLPLSRLFTAVAIFSGAGFIYRAYRTRPTLQDLAERARHPIWGLAILTFAVIYANGGIEYLPFPGDETASWIWYAHQIFLVDAYWSDKVVYHLGAYPNGWPTLIAFANAMYGVYDDSHGVAIGFVMQLGVIGASFDLVRYVMRREEAPLGDATSHAIGWIFVLFLLAAEVSWILVPTFQLIDEPLIFAFIGCFITSFLALYDTCDRRIVAAYLGIGFAACFLLKVTAAAFLPTALIVMLALACSEAAARRAQTSHTGGMVLPLIGFALLVFAPVAIAQLTWDHFKSGTSCLVSPIALLSGGTGPASQQPLAVAAGFAMDTLKFVAAYKLPLTLFSVVFLIAGLFHDRARWLVAGYAGFVAIYSIALYCGYLSCFDVVMLGKFESLPRYMRTPIRLAHYLGCICCVMVVLRARARKVRWISIKWPFPARATQAGMGIAIIALLGWQIRSVDRSLDDMRTRVYQDPVLTKMIFAIKDQAAILSAEIKRRNLREPRVSLIAQNGYGPEYDLAHYFGLKSRPDGGSNFIYTVRPPYSWADHAAGRFTTVTTAQELRAYWMTFDIIWPYRTDDWTRAVLAHLVADKACARDPERYFLVRADPSGSGGLFDCVAKRP